MEAAVRIGRSHSRYDSVTDSISIHTTRARRRDKYNSNIDRSNDGKLDTIDGNVHHEHDGHGHDNVDHNNAELLHEHDIEHDRRVLRNNRHELVYPRTDAERLCSRQHANATVLGRYAPMANSRPERHSALYPSTRRTGE
jgi:hypothetical protein